MNPAPAPELSVVVPLYNEEDNVVPLQEELLATLKGMDFELILVDDGSTDQTTDRFLSHPAIVPLPLAKNSGQSAALYTGIHAARGKIIVLMDGDMQNDPADIPRLLEKLAEGADLVCGYRQNRQDTWFKRTQSKIANGVRSRYLGDGIRDTGCTLKAMRRECRDALIPFYGMHRFIPALIAQAGFRVVELPVHHRARLHGSSKYTFARRAWTATADMLGVKWLLSRRLDLRNFPSPSSQKVMEE